MILTTSSHCTFCTCTWMSDQSLKMGGVIIIRSNVHRQFHIRDEDVFTTVFYKKMHVKNTRFSKSHLEIKLFFQKKVIF